VPWSGEDGGRGRNGSRREVGAAGEEEQRAAQRWLGYCSVSRGRLGPGRMTYLLHNPVRVVVLKRIQKLPVHPPGQTPSKPSSPAAPAREIFVYEAQRRSPTAAKFRRQRRIFPVRGFASAATPSTSLYVCRLRPCGCPTRSALPPLAPPFGIRPLNASRKKFDFAW
jgi:hypothetical protein